MENSEKFRKKQIEMSDAELCNLVEEELSKLCITGGKSLNMTVPPDVKDTDMLIGELLNRFKENSNYNNDGK